MPVALTLLFFLCICSHGEGEIQRRGASSATGLPTIGSGSRGAIDATTGTTGTQTDASGTTVDTTGNFFFRFRDKIALALLFWAGQSSSVAFSFFLVANAQFTIEGPTSFSQGSLSASSTTFSPST